MERDFIESVAQLIDRDLVKLAQELEQYPDEKSIWIVKPGIKNSGGNLALHLCGNLQHFFGTVIGKTDYVRNRDNEFAARDIPRAELLAEIEKARVAVKETLESFKPSLLLKEYPQKVYDYPMTSMHFFIHLTTHLGYHLGQVTYHRRLVVE